MNVTAIFTDKKQSIRETAADQMPPSMTVGTGDFIMLHHGSLEDVPDEQRFKIEPVSGLCITHRTAIYQFMLAVPLAVTLAPAHRTADFRFQQPKNRIMDEVSHRDCDCVFGFQVVHLPPLRINRKNSFPHINLLMRGGVGI